jgi:ATP-binding cassette subfamily B protein
VKFAMPMFTKIFPKYDEFNESIQENISGIRVVKTYVREDYEKEKFNKVSQSIFEDFSKAEKLIAFNSPLMQFSMYLVLLLISWISAKLIVATEMTTGELMSLITYAMQILMNLMMVSMIFVMVTISRASAERIVELLNEKSDLTNGKNPKFDIKDGSVSFRNVDFSYTKNKKKPCLTNINIDIKSGETVGIIGGTGSGKSSFVQLIPRLYDVTSGSVLVGGVDVKKYDLDTLRNNVAMVLQKNVLFSGTIKENLRWGNKDATDEELIHACKLAQADDFIKNFPDGYDTYIEQGGTNVSGGQKQRLCIARALLKKPKILILDDSTSAVDTKTDALIRKAFREEIPETTKFIIAQRIASVQDADKIIIMDEGKIVAFGTHEQLLKNDIYLELYNSQTKGGVTNEK